MHRIFCCCKNDSDNEEEINDPDPDKKKFFHIDREVFLIETQLDSKFAKYYQNTDSEYWGLGLENECYLQSSQKLEYETKDSIQTRLSRERYSVNYMENYHDSLRYELAERLSNIPKLKIPQLFNSHCFTKIDRKGQPSKTYTRIPQPNPKFTGKTIYEEWILHDPYIESLIHPISKECTPIFFDGDSIEFVTTHFYQTTTDKIVEEMKQIKKEFLDRFNNFLQHHNIFSKHTPFQFLETHPGLAAMITQPHRLVPFNNTTFHLHLTLPTAIYNGKIINLDLFQKQHQQVITILQWFEPYFLSRLGSSDFLSDIFEGESFAGGSMRGALSRYIGIGTFDPIKMTKGTIQIIPIEDARPSSVNWWRDKLNTHSKYKLPEKEIGMDIHFAKHYQCGIELRCLDGFPLQYLKQVLDLIVLISAYALQVPFRSQNVAVMSQEWNDVVYNSLIFGSETKLSIDQQIKYIQVLNLPEEHFQLQDYCTWQYFFEQMTRLMFEKLDNKNTLNKLSPNFKLSVLPDINHEQHEYHRKFIRGD